MSKGFRRIGAAFVEASRAMLNQEIPKDAAAISYFSLFALFPATLVLVALADSFFGWMHLHKNLLQSIVGLFPGSGVFLASNLAEITSPSAAIVVSCLIVVMWCSTWIFTFIENAMNRIWGVPKRRTFWQSRIRSISLLALGGILLLASAGATAVVSNGARAVRHAHYFVRSPVLSLMWSLILIGAGFAVAVLVFSFVYKLMPDRKVLWREAASGALVSAVVWEVASYIFAKVVPYFDYQRVYGKAGAIIALMAWVYTSTLILLFGAGFAAKLHCPYPASESDYLPLATREGSLYKLRSFPRSR